MTRRSAAVALARVANTLFFLATSAYCLLTYSPFAYQQFIRPHLVLALTDFVVWHGLLYWLAFLMTVLTLLPHLSRSLEQATRAERARARRGRWLIVSYLAAGIILGICASTTRLMPESETTVRSLLLALLFLLPPTWLALIDHLVAPPLAIVPSGDRHLLKSSLIAALAVWIAYGAAAPLRVAQAGDIALSGGAILLGIVSSGIAHVTIFTMGFLVLMTIGGVAGLVGDGRTEYRLLVGALACGLTVIITRLVFSPIAFTGAEAWLTAGCAGVAIAASWSAIARVRLADAPARARMASEVWLAPITTGDSRRAAAIGLLLLPLVAYLVTRRVTMFDWNFMVQKLVALGVWLVAFGFVHALTREDGGESASIAPARAAAVPATVLAIFCLDAAAVPRLPAIVDNVRLHPEFLLDGYAATDPSFKVIRDTVAADSIESADFYAYLRANSTVRADVQPVDIDIVQPLAPSTRHRPNIFFFLIDSLRPDYLSPYNRKVSFTPAIEKFAGDSLVFDRAFTRYGGTGLSVPSIWSGGLVFHKEYVRPFARMNALAKLLDANNYRRLITRDHITDDLFTAAADQIELDRDVPEMQHTLCRTVDELERDLASLDASDRPLFVHTRPLDLHIANVFGAGTPPGESYPGFFGAYAARVHRIDACFGGFVDFLKRSRLYDESIIILMADHGDSLGDELRWGHAYTLFPEVLRVPLIVHVPASLSGRIAADLARVSFTVDVVPTLYRLLGYRPAQLGPRFGSPLVEEPGSDLAWRRRESYVVVSSYGAVYGVLRHNGRKLYIADAINGRDYAYDVTPGKPLGTRVGITDAERQMNRRLIRDQIGELAASYRFTARP